MAEEFPDTTFIHISGFKSNNTNFGNLFGAMEDMKYLAGMLAGSRAKKDGNPKLGYMATFPIPEELRLGNAFALGMRKTCPECTLDVRWINTWHDPVKEKDGAASLFDAGAQVVFTGADTPASADVAQEKGKWGITYDCIGSCKVERCLTAPYWNWGPIYAKIAKRRHRRTYKPGYDYFDADSGGAGRCMASWKARPRPRAWPTCRAEVTDGQGHAGQDADGHVHPLRRLRRPDQGQHRQGDRAGGREDEQADLDQFPPGAPAVQVLHALVGRGHHGRAAARCQLERLTG